MYTLINGSPKNHSSNSLSFLKSISTKLSDEKDCSIFDLKKNNYEEIINNINSSKSVILSFPLYVDSPPSLVISFLDYIIDKEIKLENKLIYIIINCGFRESKHNITAINIIKSWCTKVKATYGCSLQIGAGEVVGKKKYKFISKKANKKIKEFAEIIENKQPHSDISTTMDLLNNKLYCLIANISWNKTCKKNNLSINDIKSK